ncbi:FGGY family carbohydrate kinase [Ornithinimicrobium avium]|uniref:FGGY family carbohydrate kinase n=1 Tax=Ornithinimicrobium avium TaxID=2283195 RepID=UPI00192E07C9|nr:FGGY family carbohydrate kinase [Ornithinimicrobium avium]
MAADFDIELQDAVDPLVLALDVGSTASRGALYDALGRPVGRRAKVAHSFTTATDGTSEIDPDQVVEEITTIVDRLTETLGERTVAGVAMDTFASSMVVVGADGAPLTPCFTYADSRCRKQIAALREELDDEALQQRTGTRVHVSYWPARLRWLADQRPEVVAGAAHYLSLGDYVLHRLTGTLGTGTSTASWTGMVDRHTATWYPELVEICGITPDQLPRSTTSTTRWRWRRGGRPRSPRAGRLSRGPAGSPPSPTGWLPTSAWVPTTRPRSAPPARPPGRCGSWSGRCPRSCRPGCGATASPTTGRCSAARSTTSGGRWPGPT